MFFRDPVLALVWWRSDTRSNEGLLMHHRRRSSCNLPYMGYWDRYLLFLQPSLPK